MNYTPWPAVELSDWDLSATDFPSVLSLAGHQYERIESVLPAVLDTDAFVQRVIAVVQTGEFLPFICFYWRPYGPTEHKGRFNYKDFAALPTDEAAQLMQNGGALYRRV